MMFRQFAPTRPFFLAALLLPLIIGQMATASEVLAEKTTEADVDNAHRQFLMFYRFGHFRKAIAQGQKLVKLGENFYGKENENVGILLNNLATVYKTMGRYDKAEPLVRRSLKIMEKALGSSHLAVAAVLNTLATIYDDQGRYNEAEALYKRSLRIREKTLDPDHPDVGGSLNNLAGIYSTLGHYTRAEQYYRRSLKIAEKASGSGHPSVAATLNNLAALYRVQRRYSEAELLYKRSLEIVEKALGKKHLRVATSLNNQAELYMAQGRYREAERLATRSLKIQEKVLGAYHRELGNSLNNLGGINEKLGRPDEAEPLYRRSLEIAEMGLGKDHHSIAISLNNLAALHRSSGRYREAEPLYKRSLKINEKALGPDHPRVGQSLNHLAGLYLAQSNWKQAAKNWRRATSLLVRRAERFGQIGQGVSGEKKKEVDQFGWFFLGLIKAVYRLEKQADRTSDTFQNAQWAIDSTAAGALAQMSARQGAGSSELAVIARERQDSARQWQQIEKYVNALRSSGKSDPELLTQMAGFEKRIREIDKKLANEFPDYAALASPKPLAVKQTQKLLKSDEALIMLLDTPKAYTTTAETFIWAVTRDKAEWKRAELGGVDLREKVAALRKGLSSRNARGAVSLSGNSKTDEFDLAIAHELYTKLLGPVEDIIGSKKHLMIVASGPLTALPFQVLVKQKPTNFGGAKYEVADWLMRHHAITTLPSVASLKALRGIAKTARAAPDQLIGFADPVFSRSPDKPVKTASNQGYASFFRGRNAAPGSLAQLSSLPGTRRELQKVGKILKIANKHLHYGNAASETAVKKAALARYKIVYFATHGLVSGDIRGLGEPALAFSVPQKPGKLDDGLLTASEVSELKLNADWLVMSACNTASGDKPGAEALSGLARAFFYAGAKTLLVSHWPVGDEAAVALTTRAFKLLQDQQELGRSEALRRAMLSLLNKGGASAHPSTWAPFVVVGEGGGPKNRSR